MEIKIIRELVQLFCYILFKLKLLVQRRNP